MVRRRVLVHQVLGDLAVRVVVGRRASRVGCRALLGLDRHVRLVLVDLVSRGHGHSMCRRTFRRVVRPCSLVLGRLVLLALRGLMGCPCRVQRRLLVRVHHLGVHLDLDQEVLTGLTMDWCPETRCLGVWLMMMSGLLHGRG